MVIKELMRHQSYQMTLRYAHLHPDHENCPSKKRPGHELARETKKGHIGLVSKTM